MDAEVTNTSTSWRFLIYKTAVIGILIYLFWNPSNIRFDLPLGLCICFVEFYPQFQLYPLLPDQLKGPGACERRGWSLGKPPPGAPSGQHLLVCIMMSLPFSRLVSRVAVETVVLVGS